MSETIDGYPCTWPGCSVACTSVPLLTCHVLKDHTSDDRYACDLNADVCDLNADLCIAYICRRSMGLAMAHTTRRAKPVSVSRSNMVVGGFQISSNSVPYSQLIASGLQVCMLCLHQDQIVVATTYESKTSHPSQKHKAVDTRIWGVPTEDQWNDKLKHQAVLAVQPKNLTDSSAQITSSQRPAFSTHTHGSFGNGGRSKGVGQCLDLAGPSVSAGPSRMPLASISFASGK